MAQEKPCWVDRRPTTLDPTSAVGFKASDKHASLARRMRKLALEWDNPMNMLFSGPPGCGKTTLIGAMVNDGLAAASDSSDSHKRAVFFKSYHLRGVAEVKALEDSCRLEEVLYVVVDEVDSLSLEAQRELEVIIVKFPKVWFLLACNKPRKLDPPLRSKLLHIEVPRPSNETLAMIVKNMGDSKAVTFEYLDIRKTLNYVQMGCVSEKDACQELVDMLEAGTNYQGAMALTLEMLKKDFACEVLEKLYRTIKERPACQALLMDLPPKEKATNIKITGFVARVFLASK